MLMVVLHILTGGDEMKPFQQSDMNVYMVARQSQVSFGLTPI